MSPEKTIHLRMGYNETRSVASRKQAAKDACIEDEGSFVMGGRRSVSSTDQKTAVFGQLDLH
jgi:hypothetical protein